MTACLRCDGQNWVETYAIVDTGEHIQVCGECDATWPTAALSVTGLSEDSDEKLRRTRQPDDHEPRYVDFRVVNEELQKRDCPC